MRNKIKKHEWVIALFLAIVCSILTMGTLLFKDIQAFPLTADAMGHMTKVQYIANQLMQGHIPSWFPAWYNGSAATQYYVPLSYYIMAPIYMVFRNITVTYKLFCILMYFVGGMGVWYFCKKKIGDYCGLFAIIAFCFQKFLAESLYGAGVVAQGPIFAFMPWYLYCILCLIDKPNKKRALGATVFLLLILLSHAMHAFMVCFATMAVLFLFVLFKKVSIKNYMIAVMTVLFAGMITAFWSVVGATGFENPGVPFLLPEAGKNYTADFTWFSNVSNGSMLHLSIITWALSLFAMFVMIIRTLYRRIAKKNEKTSSIYISAPLLLTAFTMIFSFGYHLPLWDYIPMANSLVPGRILSYTAVTAAITIACIANKCKKMIKRKSIVALLYIALLATFVICLNPFIGDYGIIKGNEYDKVAACLDQDTDSFDKGRYEWIAPVNCSETYYPIQYHYNLSDGWNIEGSLHKDTIWNFNIANTSNDFEYMVKQLAFWNVRTLVVNDKYHSLLQAAKTELGFKENPKAYRTGITFLQSERPSSYYLVDSRNAIVIGKQGTKLCVTYPNLIQGKSADITKYSIEELKQYKMVYLYEPQIKTMRVKKKYEEMIQSLVASGTKVVIEPIVGGKFELFDVHVVSEKVEGNVQCALSEDSPNSYSMLRKLDLTHENYITSLYNLDKCSVFYTQNEGRIKNDVLGEKSINGGSVTFVGGQLSHFLAANYITLFGMSSYQETNQENNNIVKQFFHNMYQNFGVNEAYLPQDFTSVKSSHYDYDGGSFSYESDKDEDVVISITYSPRWNITIDDEITKVSQDENLIQIHLPKGKHVVKLKYGVTKYGILGYLISLIGVVLFLLFLWKFEAIVKCLDHKCNKVIKYLQMNKESYTK